MDTDVPLGLLFAILVLLIMLSGFFSGTETALMSLNRYRLRHRANAGLRSARLAEELLSRPDRLIGLILLGNNLVNFTASSLSTLIALRIGGEAAVAISVGIFTLVVLIFAEVAPKTLAAMRPSRLALPAAYVYYPLLKVTYPIVWVVNSMANTVLRLLGVSPTEVGMSPLSHEELRTLVAETGARLPTRHRRMLLSILDLGKVAVEDIMVPRTEIIGIDLEDDWGEILGLVHNSRYSRMPIFRGSIDNILGIVDLRQVLPDLARGRFSREILENRVSTPYYIPEGTALSKQLLNFQANRRRMGLVVDEYGDILGLVTLEDILEEIVGEFTAAPAALRGEVLAEPSGGFLVSGAASVRDLNRLMDWDLPTEGPRTLNGLIVEALETIPKPGTRLTLSGHLLEIVQIGENMVKTVRVFPSAAPHRPAAAI